MKLRKNRFRRSVIFFNTKSLLTKVFFSFLKNLVVIFLHVGTVGQKWYSQAEYMINALNKSGLLEEANYAFLYVVGTPDREIKFEKFKIFWATGIKKRN